MIDDPVRRERAIAYAVAAALELAKYGVSVETQLGSFISDSLEVTIKAFELPFAANRVRVYRKRVALQALFQQRSALNLEAAIAHEIAEKFR